MDPAIQILRDRFAEMEDEDLLRLVSEEASDYRPEAIEVARQEIQRRGLDTGRPSKADTPAAESTSEAGTSLDREEAEDESEPEPSASQQDWVTCAICAGRLRSAVLLAENQVIAVFDDNREARFVKLLVCPRCGNASMFVDMQTRVIE
ncbi:MAG: hypothetical protein EHM61_17065 [Acidobacteria bacterium]|nr:MAG: hypothetical protein EHM61_17065 [Acidobacteriota bacterium]